MDYSKILFFFFGLFMSKNFINCVQTGRRVKMVGGNLTEHSKFPYLVGIMIRTNKTSFLCGGSILDNYHVISAAHCFVNFEKSLDHPWKDGSYLVIAGVTDFTRTNQPNRVMANVQKIFMPKMYHDSLKNSFTAAKGDIAILVLESSLNLRINNHLKAVRLPKNKNIGSYVNEVAVVSGYGAYQTQYVWNETARIGKWKSFFDGKLRFAKTRVLSNLECQSKKDHISMLYKLPRTNLTDKHICAQVHQNSLQRPEGVCNADSGGPLIYLDNILIGVVSTSPVSCQENVLPAIYTRVSAFVDFIEKVRMYNDTNFIQICSRAHCLSN